MLGPELVFDKMVWKEWAGVWGQILGGLHAGRGIQRERAEENYTSRKT